LLFIPESGDSMNNLPGKTGSRRVRRTREQWQHIITEYESDHLTQQEFCAKHDLGTVSFNKWLHRLKQPRESGFVALTGANPATSKQTPAGIQQGASVEVRLEPGGGIVLHLSQP